MKYKPLNMFCKQTDELKKLIAEHPDYPIIVMCDSEVVCDDGYTWWYAPDLYFSLGEILDCEQDIDEEKVFIDRDEFKEAVEEKLSWLNEYEKLPDEAFDEIVSEKLKEYEPYWKSVIVIRATV